MTLDKGAILAELKLKTETVTLSGGDVIVSEISGADYISLYSDPACHTNGSLDMAKFTPALVVRCIKDEEGNRVFSDDEAGLFAAGSSGVLSKLALAARRINGLDSAEEAAKN